MASWLSSLNGDVSIDAAPTNPNYKENTVNLTENREQRGTTDNNGGHCQAEGNTTAEEEDTQPTSTANDADSTTEQGTLEVDYLKDFMSNPEGCNSLSEYLSLKTRSDSEIRSISIVGDGFPSADPTRHQNQDSENMDRFSLELLATEDLQWTILCAELGYNSSLLMKIPASRKEEIFSCYLEYWNKTISELKYNPVAFLFMALQKLNQEKLIKKLFEIFDIRDPPQPHEYEIKLLRDKLSTVDLETVKRQCHECRGNAARAVSRDQDRGQCHECRGNVARAVSRDQDRGYICGKNEELMGLMKVIWDNLTEGEIKQVNLYLHNSKPKFGNRVLETIKTGVDLIKKLQERDLIGADNLDFLKVILNFLKRADLLKKVGEFENRLNVPEQRPTRYSQAPCNSLLQLKKHELKIQSVDMAIQMCNKTKQLKEDLLRETDRKIIDVEQRVKLELKDKEKYEKERNEKQKNIRQLEAEIRKLQKFEKSSVDKIDASNKEKGELIEFKKRQKKEIDKIKTIQEKEERMKYHKAEATEYNRLNTECNSLKSTGYLDPKVEKDCGDEKRPGNSNRRQFQERNLPILPDPNDSSENEDDQEAKEPHLHVSTQYSAHELRRKDDIVIPEKEVGSRTRVEEKKDILIMAAEENKQLSDEFMKDITDAMKNQPFNTLTCYSVCVKMEITEHFLKVTNDQIRGSKILFILVSKELKERCWPDICKMGNLNTAFYNQEPLVVPVVLEKNISSPMGIRSAQSLVFHRRDTYYKDALGKLLRGFSK